MIISNIWENKSHVPVTTNQKSIRFWLSRSLPAPAPLNRTECPHQHPSLAVVMVVMSSNCLWLTLHNNRVKYVFNDDAGGHWSPARISKVFKVMLNMCCMYIHTLFIIYCNYTATCRSTYSWFMSGIHAWGFISIQKKCAQSLAKSLEFLACQRLRNQRTAMF